MLLNKVTPYEDEYISSIIERFLIANSFEKYGNFRNLMKMGNLVLDYYHEVFPMKPIFELMDIEDWGEFYIKHSIYPFIAPFLSKDMQVKYLSEPFELKGFKGYIRKNKTLRYCPVCNAEKEYIRRSHNLPGVVACYKHKTPLYDNGKPVVDTVTDSEVKYAIYAKQFAEKELDISLEETAKLLDIKQGLLRNFENALSIFMNKYPDLDEFHPVIEIKETNFEGYKTGLVTKNMVSLTCLDCNSHFGTTIYGFNNDFRCPECQGKLTDEELFKEHLKVNGKYKLVTKYTFNTDDATLLHKDCDKHYQTTAAKFYSGERCPCETKTYEERLKEIVEKDNCFRFLGYDPKTGYVSVIHLECGLETKAPVKKFLKERECKYCSGKIWTKEKAKSFLKRNNLELLSDFNGTTKDVTVRCSNGHVVSNKFRCFIKSPVCPKCKKLGNTKIIKGSRSNSKYMMLFKYLKENYKSDQLIFEKDLQKDVPDLCNSMTLYRLKKQNKLFTVKQGVYSLTNDKYSTMKLMEKMFVDRKDTDGFIARRSLLSNFGFSNFHTIFEVCTSLTDKDTSARYDEHRIYVHPLPSYYRSDKKEESQLTDFINNIPYLKADTGILIDNVKNYIFEHNLDTDFIINNLKGEFVDAFKK